MYAEWFVNVIYLYFACCFRSVWVWNLVCHIREEYRLNVFENRMLRKIFWPEMDEVRGDEAIVW